jgi:hypothetical protein
LANGDGEASVELVETPYKGQHVGAFVDSCLRKMQLAAEGAPFFGDIQLFMSDLRLGEDFSPVKAYDLEGLHQDGLQLPCDVRSGLSVSQQLAFDRTRLADLKLYRGYLLSTRAALVDKV